MAASIADPFELRLLTLAEDDTVLILASIECGVAEAGTDFVAAGDRELDVAIHEWASVLPLHGSDRLNRNTLRALADRESTHARTDQADHRAIERDRTGRALGLGEGRLRLRHGAEHTAGPPSRESAVRLASSGCPRSRTRAPEQACELMHANIRERRRATLTP
jgi:hypothetical protein